MLTKEQYAMMLECEVAAIQVYAHESELAFDVVPRSEYLTMFNIEWQLAGREVYLD